MFRVRPAAWDLQWRWRWGKNVLMRLEIGRVMYDHLWLLFLFSRHLDLAYSLLLLGIFSLHFSGWLTASWSACLEVFTHQKVNIK
jgi:hypothetical protein